jgi:hypothetical protein
VLSGCCLFSWRSIKVLLLNLSIPGLLNNAGIMQMRPTKNAFGSDMPFVTNHLGPFALTEALVPSLPNDANIVLVVSAVEDPERRPAVAAGFRGGRYISAGASALKKAIRRGDPNPYRRNVFYPRAKLQAGG